MSQRALAERVGVDVSYVSKVENEHLPAPSEQTISAIARVLGDEPEVHLGEARKVPANVRAAMARHPVAATQIIRELTRRRLSTDTYASVLEMIRSDGRRAQFSRSRASRIGR